MLYVIAGILGVVGVVVVFVGKSKGKLKSLIDQTPTTPLGQLRDGQHAEIKGIVSCEKPLLTPDSGIPCVYYSYEIKRRERRRSSSGSTTYHWRTVDRGTSQIPFTLADSEGSVTIDPEGSQIDAPVIVDRYIEPGENLAEGALKSIVSAASMVFGERRKLVVKAIATGCELYVLGDVSAGADGHLRVSKGDGKFFISTKSEEQLAKSLGLQTILFYVIGTLLIVGAVVFLTFAFR